MLKLTPKAAAISIALVIVVAAVSYVATDVLSIDLGGRGSADDVTGDVEFVSGGLRIGSRDHFAVCVDTYETDPVVAEGAMPIISRALALAAESEGWSSSVGFLPPTADLGCPGGPAALAADAQTTQTGAILAVGIISEQASPFKVFLFVTPENVIQNLFVGAPPIATQERLRRSQHLFTTATFAIFVSPSQAADLDFLRTAFLVDAEVEETQAFYQLRATPKPTIASDATP